MIPKVIQNQQRPAWISYIHQRISKNKNFLCIIAGETGSGKSESSLSIALMADHTFNAERIIFNLDDLMRLRKEKKLKKGSVLVYEEVGVEHSNQAWQSKKNRVLSYLLQTFRDENYIVIFNVPYMGLFLKTGRKLLHAYFETASIDEKKQICKIKPYVLQYNEWYDKTYKKYLKVKIKGKGLTPLKKWGIPRPPLQLRQEYLKKKAAYKEELDKQLNKMLSEEKEGKKKLKKFPQHCQHCNYSWDAVKENPAACPRCRKAIYKKEEEVEAFLE